MAHQFLCRLRPCVIELLERRDLMSVGLYMTEADGSTSTGYQYAPVEFPSSTTVVSGGITYHALDGTQASLGYPVWSPHAQGVSGSFLSYANGQVGDIWAGRATTLWMNAVMSSGTATGTDGAPLLNQATAMDPGVRLINNSWIGGAFVYGSSGTYSKTNAMARGLDNWVTRDDILMTSAAVTGYMAWVGRNGLAVRGGQGFSLSGQTIRQHADLFGPGDTAASHTTPQTGGLAARIIGAAQADGNADGQHHEVAKSILMTATDKGNFTSTFNGWTRDLGNNLDSDAGAGRLSSSRVDHIIASGQKALTPLTSLLPGSVIAAPVLSTTASGWSYISSIAETNAAAVMFSSATEFSDLTATLAWDVVPKLVGTLVDAGADNFADLNVRLYSVNESGGVYTLGSALSEVGLSSATTNDNVEHLYYNGAPLPAGNYAFVLEYADTPNLDAFTTDAAFSYMVNAPTGPGPLTVSSQSATDLLATWTDNSATETGFRVDIATNSSFSTGLRQWTLPANSTSLVIPSSDINGVYYIRVVALGSTASGQSNTYFWNILPTITASQINDVADAQRSMVKSVKVTFSETVTPQTGAFTLTRKGSEGSPATLSWSSTDQKTFTITFSGTNVVGGSLMDGLYTFKVIAASIKDAGNSSPTTGLTLTFHRLFGDSDGNRDVDTVDTNAFKLSLNQPANYVWHFDYNNDLLVDDLDLLQLRARLSPIRL